jgi:tryptophan synthase
MGTTGSSDNVNINNQLPAIVARVRDHSSAYLAVGFGVSNNAHFQYVADTGADGVVVGSRIVQVIKTAPQDQLAEKIRQYCADISGKGSQSPVPTQAANTDHPIVDGANVKLQVPRVLPQLSSLPARFGQFGGQYVPEALVDCLVELEEAHKLASTDPEFWKEFESYYGYMNRPSKLYLAERLTEHAGGAKIWLKREDLFVLPCYFANCCLTSASNHTGSHKINNAIGQVK